MHKSKKLGLTSVQVTDDRRYGISFWSRKFCVFFIRLKSGWSYAKKEKDSEQFVGVLSDRIEVLPN